MRDQTHAPIPCVANSSARMPMAPGLWATTLSGAPVLDRTIGGLVPATVRRWIEVAPEIDQFALDQHYLSVHLGGSKRLWRRGEGGTETRDVAVGAHSVVPAGAASFGRRRGRSISCISISTRQSSTR